MQPLQNTTVKTANLDSKAANMEVFSDHAFNKPSGFGRIKNYLIYLFLIGSCAFAAYAYLTRPNETPAVDSVLELKGITNLISQDDDWDLNRINAIFYHWGNLSKNQQQQIKQTAWFGEFANALSDHLKRNRYLDSLERTQDNNVYDLLNTLAVVIDAPNIHYRAAKSEPITKVMRDKLVKIQDQAGTDKKHTTAPANVAATRKASSQGNSEQRATAVADSNPINKTQTTGSPKKDRAVERIASVTTAEAKTDVKADTPNVNSDDSVQRNNVDSDKTPVTADTTRESSRQATAAKRANLLAKSNPMINSPAELHINKSRSIPHPTPAELDYVISQYIDGYEKGNVNKILELLSLNAKTSAQSNAKEIGAYLTDLFSSTKDRQLFIRNVKWKFDGNIAKGIGDIHTLLLPSKTSGDIVSTKGKVQIIAKKVNNAVLITHLYSTQNPR